VTRWIGPANRVAIRKNDLTVVVVDESTHRELSPLLTHGSEVTHVAFNKVGDLIVTASDDNNARIWNWSAGNLLSPPLSHNATVTDAVFSSDARRVATACADGSVRVWDVASGDLLTPPLRLGAVVNQLTFERPDRLLVNCDGLPPVPWDLRPQTEPIAELMRVAERAAGGRIDGQRGFVPFSPQELRELLR
jgi:WD40 repeat protein